MTDDRPISIQLRFGRIHVRCENQDDGRVSITWPPYDWLQLTRQAVRGFREHPERAPAEVIEEEVIATHLMSGDWFCYLDGQTYSDVVIMPDQDIVPTEGGT